MASDRRAAARRRLLQRRPAGSLAAAAAGAGGGRGRGTDANVLFIMADLGYADLSLYGRRDYETPNIDRIARNDLRG